MRPVQAYVSFWQNYFNFKGRSTRSEFWWVFLWNAPVFLFAIFSNWVLPCLPVQTYLHDAVSHHHLSTIIVLIGVAVILLLFLLYSFAVALPGFSLHVRRLHDIGMRGWWYITVTLVLCFVHSAFVLLKMPAILLFLAKIISDIWVLFILFLSTKPSAASKP
ncbi:MAG: DUF805 domain-containing protein [Sporolactobacillus sp.]